MDHERTCQKTHTGTGRDTQGKEGNKGAAGGCVIGSLRSCHPFDGAFTKLLGVFGHFLLRGIGDKGRHDGTRTGDDTGNETDEGTTDDGQGGSLPVLFVGEEVLDLLLKDGPGDGRLKTGEDLGDTE